ncbi:zinc finger protein 62-like [Pectinophora gossypiella]|uniref:Protein krueppel n=1 Tax=Pectinophora gossypiella TaxID=13191 RepID=A0A1E1WNQ2_PECGO|nr:zinc finger protein 62-like [Pectinophora gossypiella]
MANSVNVKNVVKHLVNGTFEENLCRVCLLPLGEFCENIFTKISKHDDDYCVADALETVCQIKFSGSDRYNVCYDCFVMASTAYRFFLLTKRSNEILNYYVKELERNIYSVEVPENPLDDNNLCIPLTECVPMVQNFNFDIEDLKHYKVSFDEEDSNIQPIVLQEQNEKPLSETILVKEDLSNVDDAKIVVVIEEDGKKTFYKLQDGTTELFSDKMKHSEMTSVNSVSKVRRKRDPMTFRKCSQCPVQYRFLGKLKMHMKTEHNMDLFVCKVCKAIMEDEQEFNRHLKSHMDVHRCNICDTVFKKRDTIIAHLKWHEEMKNMSKLDGAHVCELCGYILPNEDQLKEHYDKKHDKKYTCFYCGKMYKGELSFEMHIKKHEMHKKSDKKRKNPEQGKEQKEPEDKNSKKRTMCPTCGGKFVDERSLMWHSMLHTNERPYSCDVCGRGFVSLNRRNQHMLCAHTMPTKRCPLCSALFHLRSMVNTHIKKVHLKAHKRRNRTSKHQNVCWRTEAVPIQELSVSIQNEILEMQTGDKTQDQIDWTQKIV